MANSQQNNTQTSGIQGLLGRYLELRTKDEAASRGHLDEDTLNAFTEGMLNERLATPIVSHLTDCSFCRHKTAELVRLDLEFAEMDEPTVARESSEPVSVASVLNGILSRIFGTGEAAVFAHEEREDESENADRCSEENKNN